MSLLNNCYLNFNYFTEASSLSFLFFIPYFPTIYHRQWRCGKGLPGRTLPLSLNNRHCSSDCSPWTAEPTAAYWPTPQEGEKEDHLVYNICTYIHWALLHAFGAKDFKDFPVRATSPPPLLCNKNYIRRTTNCQRPYKKRCWTKVAKLYCQPEWNSLNCEMDCVHSALGVCPQIFKGLL